MDEGLTWVGISVKAKDCPVFRTILEEWLAEGVHTSGPEVELAQRLLAAIDSETA